MLDPADLGQVLRDDPQLAIMVRVPGEHHLPAGNATHFPQARRQVRSRCPPGAGPGSAKPIACDGPEGPPWRRWPGVLEVMTVPVTEVADRYGASRQSVH